MRLGLSDFLKRKALHCGNFCLDIFPLTNVKSGAESCSSPEPAAMITLSGSNAFVIHKPSPAPLMHFPELHGHSAGTHGTYRGILLNNFHLPSKRASRELEKGQGHIRNVCPSTSLEYLFHEISTYFRRHLWGTVGLEGSLSCHLSWPLHQCIIKEV